MAFQTYICYRHINMKSLYCQTYLVRRSYLEWQLIFFIYSGVSIIHSLFIQLFHLSAQLTWYRIYSKTRQDSSDICTIQKSTQFRLAPKCVEKWDLTLFAYTIHPINHTFQHLKSVREFAWTFIILNVFADSTLTYPWVATFHGFTL